MLKLVKIVAICAAMFAGACAAQAQTQSPASIDAAAWLAGRWVGQGFGGQMEETWAPPVDGQMVGHFRHWRDGEVQFYEIMLLDMVEGGVRMRVKHFNPDFTGWEERGEWHAFEPVSAGPDAILFEGLEIRREGEDRMVMSIRIRRGDEVTNEVLRFQRAPL